MSQRNLEKYPGKRKNQINLYGRFTDDERYLLRQLAEAKGRTLNTFCEEGIALTVSIYRSGCLTREDVLSRQRASTKAEPLRNMTIWVDIDSYRGVHHAAIDLMLPAGAFVRAAVLEGVEGGFEKEGTTMTR